MKIFCNDGRGGGGLTEKRGELVKNGAEIHVARVEIYIIFRII